MMEPLVLSSSAFGAFKRCPKSYELGYELLLDPSTNQAVEDGASFHRHAASYANHFVGKPHEDLDEDDMYDVWRAYWEQASGWSAEVESGILMVEEPLYTLLQDEVAQVTPWPAHIPPIYIRTTFDLVYEREDGTIVGRDYKTFSKAPTLDLDLDFQGRIYIAALMRKYPDRPVEFEYEYVRRVPPGTPNSKGVWKPEECYLTFPLVISRREADAVWKEAQWVGEAIWEARTRKRFWRTDLKGSSPFTCGSCFYKDICKAELEHGALTEQDLAILSPNRKDPVKLPDDLPTRL